MKSPLILTILFLFLTACAHQNPTHLSFSGSFKITLPSEFVAGGTIFSIAEETAVKSAFGAFISGGTLTTNNQNLPKDFDITRFPDYLLRLRSVDDLDADTAMLFKNSASMTDHTYGIDNLTVIEDEYMKLYLLCKTKHCSAYVIRHGIHDHILSIHSMNIDRDVFLQIAKGSLNVKQR